jgi:hypothetical protein
VTKRNSRWFLPEEFDRLVHSTRHHGLFLVHLVRDPRDVLTSQKRGREGFYVQLDRWQRSIEAGERLLERLDGHPRVMTLRYEDVITNAEATAIVLQQRIGLQIRPGVRSWANLDENLVGSGGQLGRADAMHGVRRFSPASIGRWRQDPEQSAFVSHLLSASPQRKAIARMMERYGYHVDGPASSDRSGARGGRAASTPPPPSPGSTP